MKCQKCGANPLNENVSIYRVNPLGEIGIWRCWLCMTPEQQETVDPETKRLADIIAGKETPTT